MGKKGGDQIIMYDNANHLPMIMCGTETIAIRKKGRGIKACQVMRGKWPKKVW